MKKILPYAFIILVTIIFSIVMFYPRELTQITGKEINVDINTNLKIIYRQSILEGGTTVDSYNSNDAKEIVRFLKSHRYVKMAYVNYQKFDDMDVYSISIKSDKNELLRIATRGSGHLSIIDKYGRWSTYRVIDGKFDLKFLETFYKSLSKNVN
ncbi:hypothetical protein LGK97_13060 [Clostridium sp. CS001]|uniref:hypothetical protein n=1 Tax=Clostridium sp. CS001 TaxID=2880648 RepID=UPI001CF5173F|nr:hypothetical protein [Clostridium sp. CS001]MCB2290690.1 hypothetical protein [Clostridium sp. CS001]